MKLLQLTFIPRSADFALLLLRLWFGGVLLVNHGWQKITMFTSMEGHFPDPLNIGAKESLLLAVFAEVLCPVLVIAGWATRLAALAIAIELGTAFVMVHHGRLAMGPGSGELAFLYVGPFIAILFAGAGKYSADGA